MREDRWQEIYTTHDLLELAAARGLLEQAGIRTRVRDLSSTPYPVTFGPLAEKRIAVPTPSAPHARRLLREAAADGFLPPTGHGSAPPGEG